MYLVRITLLAALSVASFSASAKKLEGSIIDKTI